MADDDPTGLPSHRPLPSLGYPLLRDDVARARRRRVQVAASAAGGVGLVIAVALFWPRGGSPAPDDGHRAPSETVPIDVGYVAPIDAGPALPDAGPPPPPVPPPVAMPAADGRVRTEHPFGTATGFRPAATAAGLTGAEADAVIAALDGVMDFRRCRPDDTLVVERDARGAFLRFEYRASITQVWEARVDDTGALVGGAVEVPIETTRIAQGGTVSSSLGAALDAAGLGRSLVGVFVDVFEGRIDFNHDTRGGDGFRLLVDRESVGGEVLRWGTVHALEYRSQRRGTFQAFWFAPRPELAEFYDDTGRAMHGGWLRTPLRYDHISSPFNPRRMHPVLHRIMPHNGIDFSAGSGTPVWAAADGEVTFAGPRGPNGNLVTLRHEGGFESAYAHLLRFAPGLRAGRRVMQREVIGYVGSTGRSTGPHLHFGLRRRGAWVDPASELNGPGRMLPASLTGRFREAMAGLRRELEAIALPSVAAPGATADAPATEAATADPATDEVLGDEELD